MYTFQKKVTSKNSYFYLYHLYKPTFFDTTLCKGIQYADPVKFSTKTKESIFHTIVNQYQPSRIEIGSLDTFKMKDTIDLYHHLKRKVQDNKMGMNYYNPLIHVNQLYVSVPSYTKLEEAVENGITSFTFSTSMSNVYQVKTTGKNVKTTKEELLKSFELLKSVNHPFHTMLYISCIDECPFSGKNDIQRVVREILEYHVNYDFDVLCLTDTCGNLKYDELEYIIDTVMHFGVHKKKLSIQFQMNEKNRKNVEKMLWYCFNKNISNFVVSLLNEENQITDSNVKKGYLLRNIDYHTVYHVLHQFIEWKMDQSYTPLENTPLKNTPLEKV